MKSPNIVALGPPSMLKIAQRLRPIEGAPILERYLATNSHSVNISDWTQEHSVKSVSNTVKTQLGQYWLKSKSFSQHLWSYKKTWNLDDLKICTVWNRRPGQHSRSTSLESTFIRIFSTRFRSYTNILVNSVYSQRGSGCKPLLEYSVSWKPTLKTSMFMIERNWS